MGEFFFDDPVFPRTLLGRRQAGICEAADPVADGKHKQDEGPGAVASFAEQQARTQAMSAVLGWVEEGDFTYSALDEYVLGVADLDGDMDISDEEDAIYNSIWKHVPDALMTLGAETKDVNDLVNGEEDAAAVKIGKLLAGNLDENGADDDELIASFALGEEAVLESCLDDEKHQMVLEAVFKKRKVVRDGQVQVVKKRVSGKVRLSSAMKAALKKARRKAFTGAAKLARRMSMRMRKRRGL